MKRSQGNLIDLIARDKRGSSETIERARD